MDYVNNDSLGKIDNSHLAIADLSPNCAKDPKCLKLNSLHSIAVDYVKSGKRPILNKKDLANRWPDYMELTQKKNIVESKSVLGKLYREVKTLIKDEEKMVFRGYID